MLIHRFKGDPLRTEYCLELRGEWQQQAVPFMRPSRVHPKLPAISGNPSSPAGRRLETATERKRRLDRVRRNGEQAFLSPISPSGPG